jgi:hypothetical protein
VKQDEKWRKEKNIDNIWLGLLVSDLKKKKLFDWINFAEKFFCWDLNPGQFEFSQSLEEEPKTTLPTA